MEELEELLSIETRHNRYVNMITVADNHVLMEDGEEKLQLSI